ncbi:MAG: ChbG/HpnK family deacetylase [Caldilineaceae bacterium]|nr:ChbG/HpnK family deacetylase [Caldilineaceae bacterium]
MAQDSIFLLVRADDIGFSHAGNLACIDVFTKGICRSVELMAPCPWFPEAVKLLHQHRDYDVGVHLTLTSEWDNLKWRALTGPSSITNEDGYFYRMYRKNDNYPDEITLEATDWDPADLEREFRAQIELILKYVPWVTHLTTHMGGLRDDPRWKEVVDKLTAEYGLEVDIQSLGFERFRPFGDNNQALLPEEKTEAMRKGLAELAPGRWIHVDHPAYDAPETRAIHHVGYEGVAVDRQGVVEAWTDAEVLAIIERRGIQLLSYGDLKKGKLAAVA